MRNEQRSLERNYFEDLEINRRMILKWILALCSMELELFSRPPRGKLECARWESPVSMKQMSVLGDTNGSLAKFYQNCRTRATTSNYTENDCAV
jgi:hypothetical protein